MGPMRRLILRSTECIVTTTEWIPMRYAAPFLPFVNTDGITHDESDHKSKSDRTRMEKRRGPASRRCQTPICLARQQLLYYAGVVIQ